MIEDLRNSFRPPISYRVPPIFRFSVLFPLLQGFQNFLLPLPLSLISLSRLRTRAAPLSYVPSSIPPPIFIML